MSVLASALMGTIQGSGTTNVASTGVFTIPLMKRTGYAPHLAGAIEAVASNGGQIMPPVMGIAAFIMVEFLGIGYEEIVLAGILPAIVYFAAVFFAVDFEAAKAGLVGLPRSELPSIKKTMAQGWQFVLPIAVLVYFMLVLKFSPQISAIYSTGALIVASYFKKNNRITPKIFLLALRNSAFGMMLIAPICAISGIVVASFELTGLSYRLSFLLIEFAGDSLLLLLVMSAIAGIILGMGLPTSATYILGAILLAPALVEAGVPKLAAHFFVFYFGVSALITPPHCTAVFVASSIAGSEPMKTGLTAVRLGIAAFVAPFIFVYHPALLMEGSAVSIILITITTLIAVIGLAAGLGGYLLKPISFWWRIPLICGALLIIHPATLATIVGVTVIAIPVLYQFVMPRLRVSTTK